MAGYYEPMDISRRISRHLDIEGRNVTNSGLYVCGLAYDDRSGLHGKYSKFHRF